MWSIWTLQVSDKNGDSKLSELKTSRNKFLRDRDVLIFYCSNLHVHLTTTSCKVFSYFQDNYFQKNAH